MIIDVILEIAKDYGMDTVQIGLIGFCFWKLFTNHLKHMDDKLDVQTKKIRGIAIKTGKIRADLSDVKERVATIEGRCSAYHNEKIDNKKIKK